MKQLLSISWIFISFLGLAACSNDEETASDRLETYVDYWQEENFTDMYEMISNKEHYATEDFVDRYQKIYNDLEVTDLSIDFQIPESETEESPVSFPLNVSMNTIAGEVSFETEVNMIEKDVEEETKWYIEWDPGLIFPELVNGADVAIETTSPARGEIYDRNQSGLAINDTIFSIGIQPSRFENETEEKQAIANLLDITVENIDQALSADWVGENTFVPLKDMPSDLDPAFEEDLFSIPSVVKQNKTGRAYPYGEAAAHLVGYIGQITAEELEEQEAGRYGANDLIGKRGLEQLFEDRLKGERGVTIIASSENGEEATIAEKPVQDGENITVTIDAALQQTIFESYQGDAGTASAIDPKTGETLALVSSPAFDPNQLTYGISQAKWDELQNDDQSPLTNRFAANFSPGSSIKPITAAVGLVNNSIDPNAAIEIDGKTWSKDGWGNYSVTRVSESSEPVDLANALIRSDNIYFAQQALNMGSDAFVNGMKKFGIGQEFPFTYPIEDGSISASGTIDEEILLADSGYGQGQMQVSSLQLATAYSAFLNDGNIIQPTLELDEEDGAFWLEDVITNQETINLIQDALRQIVVAPNGTAPEAAIDEVSLSGKTGTAELKSSQAETDGQENGWFVSYPEDESILLSMMVEHVEGKGGSHYTVEKAANIYKQLY